jgi:hypothetical protein
MEQVPGVARAVLVCALTIFSIVNTDFISTT